MNAKFKYIGAIFSGLLMLSACSDNEIVAPNAPFSNPFDISADATEPELVLRRDFYEKTGVYILFDDVVGEKVNAFGETVTEYLDFGWNMTGDSYGDEFKYIEGDIEQKRIVAGIIEKEILPHIIGSSYQPYSVLPCTGYRDWSGPIYIKMTRRCTLLNVEPLIKVEPGGDLSASVGIILKGIVQNMIDDSDYEDKEPFWDISDEYYGSYISEISPEWVNEQDMSILYEVGFISYYPDYYKEVEYDEFPTSNSDIKAFVNLIMDNTEDEVYEKFEEYPLVIKKYEILKNLMTALGYKF